eukprot:TRINITY_DN1416_c0_g1_i1.p1 TRINITY_DN1416_c0_g1~~TRINITY_DN1416_c0_g1_i1.p1  ORF type:complete len:769 (+),score=294.70 TRINITY_DN1416_c0_g1_i1:214-2307(+)
MLHGVVIEVQQSDKSAVDAHANDGTTVLLANIGFDATRQKVPILDTLPDLLCSFFSPAGRVLRVVVFDKNGHAKGLVEFQSAQEAGRARESLDGKYLSSGQLVTIAQSSAPAPLKVDPTNPRGRDYTTGFAGASEVLTTSSDSGRSLPSGESPVVLVSNVPTERGITCRCLFNLFSTCGDVLKVKILHNNRETALIEFRNSNQAMLARQNLNWVNLFGKALRVTASSKTTVTMPDSGGELNEDFSHSDLHRFKKPGSRNFNHIHQPSSMLHISNIPVDVSDSEVEAMICQCAQGQFRSFKTVGDKKMGLATMPSVNDAVVVLMYLHGICFDRYPDSPIKFSFAQRDRQEAVNLVPDETSVLLANVGTDQHNPLEVSQLALLPDILYHFFMSAVAGTGRNVTVLRVIVFEKGGLFKGLVEFASPTDAAAAADAAEGKQLASGQVITVTNSSLEPPLKVDPTNARGRDYTVTGPPMGGKDGFLPAYLPGAVAAPGPEGQVGPVVLLSSLPVDRGITCRCLFNLFSTCGDVLKVKILHNNRETALIEFRNSSQAAVARQNLNGVPVGGKRVRVTHSTKQEVTMPETRAGEESHMLNQDFTHSELHRFKKPGSRNCSHVHPPSPLLHISNIPAHISDHEVEQCINQFGSGQFHSFKTVGDKKMGTATMNDVSAAVAVLLRSHGQPCDGYPGSSLRITFARP